jgi:hypothetical protein
MMLRQAVHVRGEIRAHTIVKPVLRQAALGGNLDHLALRKRTPAQFG